MENISVDDIRKILEALSEEDIVYCHLRSANFEVVLSANGEGLGNFANSPSSATAPISIPVTNVATTPNSTAPPAPRATTHGRSIDEDDHSVPVTAPMPGSFYRAADPSSAPFIEVGCHVTAESTIGLIEAMKVFSAVRAGVNGTVASIDAVNDSFVEFGTTLARIIPG